MEWGYNTFHEDIAIDDEVLGDVGIPGDDENVGPGVIDVKIWPHI